MKQKIKLLWKKLRSTEVVVEGYSEEQVETAYKLGYNDGRKDGLTVAREQATKSLKEILWAQNQSQK